METSLLTAQFSRKPDVQGMSLEMIQRSKEIPEAKKIEEVARQFESMLLRQMLTEARKPLYGTADGEQTAVTSIYQDQVNSALADAMSSGGGIGLAKQLCKEWLKSIPKPDPKTGKSGSSDADVALDGPRATGPVGVHPL